VSAAARTQHHQVDLPASRAWVKDAAQWAGSSEDYVAQALLASVAGLCGQGVSARITKAWSEPVILWQALVGGPSTPAPYTASGTLALSSDCRG
jgi:hypothetical protein